MERQAASKGEQLVFYALEQLGCRPRLNYTPPKRPDPKIWAASKWEIDITAFLISDGELQMFGVEIDGHPVGHGKEARPKDTRKSLAMRDIGYDAVTRLRYSGQRPIEKTDIILPCDYNLFVQDPTYLKLFVVGLKKSLAFQGLELDITGFRPTAAFARGIAAQRLETAPQRAAWVKAQRAKTATRKKGTATKPRVRIV
jgi:hypothetical protein